MIWFLFFSFLHLFPFPFCVPLHYRSWGLQFCVYGVVPPPVPVTRAFFFLDCDEYHTISRMFRVAAGHNPTPVSIAVIVSGGDGKPPIIQRSRFFPAALFPSSPLCLCAFEIFTLVTLATAVAIAFQVITWDTSAPLEPTH